MVHQHRVIATQKKKAVMRQLAKSQVINGDKTLQTLAQSKRDPYDSH